MTPNINISHLEVYTTPYDIRRDMYFFIEHCKYSEIKRTVYGNYISKGEYKRITKALKHPELMEDYEKEMGIWWIDYVDKHARLIDWISYDTEGEYRGYSSSRPAFDDNYIEVKEDNFERFLRLSALEQEKYLYRHFKNHYGKKNLLMSQSKLGRLDTFDTWGSATGVIPTLNFSKSQSILLDVLKTLDPNTWYATKDLIQYMKKNHPWFLIPEEVYIEESDGWRKPKKKVKYDRYYNFTEGRRYYRVSEKHISDSDPEGFEKVEGRFIERFLESFMLTLGYVDVAYSKEKYSGENPEMETLLAFKLNTPFSFLIKNQTFKPKVSIQANFEIYIDSPIYPIKILQQLEPITDIVKEDKQIILKLKKQYVLNHLLEEPDFKLIQFLENLSDTPLPQNIRMELQEWTSQTDVFTLYENFGLYEGLKKQTLADPHTEATISPTLRLIRRPTILYDKLKKGKNIPMQAKHEEKTFQLFASNIKTVFPTQKIEKIKKVAKEKIAIQRTEWITYNIPHTQFYDAFMMVLLKNRCPVEIDKVKQRISFLKKDETQIKTLLNEFKTSYQISVKK